MEVSLSWALSLVVSSPAFAFDVTPVAPTVTVDTTQNKTVRGFTMGQANPTCGGSTDGTLLAWTSTFSPLPASNGTFTASTGSVELGAYLGYNADAVGRTSSMILIQRPSRSRPTSPARTLAEHGTVCRIYTFNFTYVGASTKNFELNASNPTVSTC